MIKSISILGSTGSIGSSTIDIILQNKKKFNVFLLTANSNYLKLSKQAIKTNANYVFLADKRNILKLQKKLKKFTNIKIVKSFNDLEKIFKRKNDIIMSAITGLSGLEYNLKLISKTKKILIANKESIICGWNLIKKQLVINKTILEPVDSEHFAIAQLLKIIDAKVIKNIYVTASGGPFLNKNLDKFKNITVKSALKHPNWSMGKKISVDSATLVNKVFEIIECYRLFDIPMNKFKIIIHPQSFVHSIFFLNNGLSIALMHKPDMKIPISILLGLNNYNLGDIISLDNKNFYSNLSFSEVDKKKFPVVSLLDKILKRTSLMETAMVTANDYLVENFLNNKIKFNQISRILINLFKKNKFLNLRVSQPKNLKDIQKIRALTLLKTTKLSII